MILYRLRCDGGHEFEGWFRDSGSFDTQARQGLLTCPECGTSAVERALMAPAVRTRQAAEPARPASPSPTEGALPAVLPDRLRAMLQRLRAEVERHCDDVGDGFAQEARRMHRGDAPERGIYGNATEEERDELAAEGIAVGRIPWIERADG